jgi:beta-glucosidase
MPLTMHFGKKLVKLVRTGKVTEDVIDEAVLRILRQKIKFAQVGQLERYGSQSIVSMDHKALAREAAQKSITLLKNEHAEDSPNRVLPIDATCIKSIGVIGKLASMPNIGDKGSSMVRPPYVVTPLAGIHQVASRDCDVVYNSGNNIGKAVDMSRQADIAIVVAGYTHKEEGEHMPFSRGGDRDSLTLKPHEEKLIEQVAAANPNTVVVLMGGSAIIT